MVTCPILLSAVPSSAAKLFSVSHEEQSSILSLSVTRDPGAVDFFVTVVC